jgi:hypothetical protein
MVLDTQTKLTILIVGISLFFVIRAIANEVRNNKK